jgi:cytochrome c
MSLEFNKIAAAVLTGGVLAMASGFVADLLIHEDKLEQSVYQVAGVESSQSMAADSGPSLEPVLPLLATASVEEGEGIAKKCAACHSFEKGGANKVGPNLWGVVGAAVASHDGYSYSDALAGAPDETWSYAALNHFLADPKGYTPGTKMSFAGLKKVEERAAMIAYLRSLSDSPLPLPTEEEIGAVLQEAAAPAEGAAEGTAETAAEGAMAAAEGAMEAAGGSGILALLASADADAGSKVARKCSACHSFDEGGANKVGPNLWGVVGADIASHEGYSYSDALSGKEGTWDYESLAAFLEDPKAWAPGTKMSFAGIKKPEELADLIAYLRSLAAEPLPLPDKAEAEMPAAAPEGGGEQLSLQEILTTPIYELDGHQQARKHLETQRGLKVRLAIEQELVGQELFLKERIDAALPERGAELAQSCAGCHSWDAKGADLIGPNLFGVLGREVGSRESYDYSECLSSFTDPKRAWTFWSFQLFIEFLAQPANQLGDCGEDHPIVSEHDERIALAAFFRLQGAQPYLIE